jgi:hypothetical protein
MRKALVFIFMFFLSSGFARDTVYCDLAGDGGVGSAANPWSLQEAADSTGIDTICLVKGTVVLSDTIDFDTKSGTEAGGFIQFVGVNNSWAEDGTRAIIDGNGAVGACATITQDYLHFRNLRFTGSADHDLNITSASTYLDFLNCQIDSAADAGIYTAGSGIYSVRKCLIYGNAEEGIDYLGSYSAILYCMIRNNGTIGINARERSGVTIRGCVLHKNGTTAIDNLTIGSRVENCVIDSSVTGVIVHANADWVDINACRITGNTTGLNANSKPVFIGYTYFALNADDTANVSKIIQHYDNGVETNVWGGATSPYINAKNDDFNIDTSSVGRRIRMDMD